MPQYRVSTNPKFFELRIIHQFISKSYWAKNIPIELMQKAIENSLCFAVLHHTESKDILVGFARMITDKATFAYLADVFILEEHRGTGLSKQLMKAILSHQDLQGLRRMVLATRDAHGLYEQFGFKKLSDPQFFMELWEPDVYQN